MIQRFREWFWANVYLPRAQKWARARVQELAGEQDAAYERLMHEFDAIAAAAAKDREPPRDH
jgi:hypothetical protein